MEEIDGRLRTMKSMRKIAKSHGEEFADEIEYKWLKKKSKSTNHKYNRLAQEVKRLEQLLEYNDKSTGDASSSSSTYDGSFLDGEYGSALKLGMKYITFANNVIFIS